MSLIYDCIIVGGGPSGGSTAYNLAKKGCSVLLIDKANFPRMKPCGGGVAPEITKWLDIDFTPVISYKVKKVCCTWDVQEGSTGQIPDELAPWMVRRDLFDHHIVKNAQVKGAEVMEGTKVLSIEKNETTWIVKTDKGEFKAKYLVAADGSKGIIAKQLGFENRKKVIAGAMEIEIPYKVMDDATLYLEFGMIKNGYIWNFPKQDGFSVGIGSFNSQDGKKMHGILDEYMELSNLDKEGCPKYGHPIYLWDGHQTLHTDSALLVGEAACLVDPFTAEGIRAAVFSGAMAAEAIDESLKGDKKALARYSKIIQKEHGTEMVWAKRLSKICYAFPKPFYNIILKRTTAAQTFGYIFSGSLKYSELAPRVLKRLISFR